MLRLRVACALLVLVAAVSAQVNVESVRVSGVRLQIAHSPDEALPAAVATVLDNADVCCGRGSSLEDVVAAIKGNLQETAAKLQGRHVLPDGRPYILSATFYATQPHDGTLAARSILLSALRANHPLLMVWKSQLYVVYGANYTEQVTPDPDGGSAILETVDQLQLFEPASGRHAIFDGAKDNWGQVEGVIEMTLAQSSS